MLDRESTVEQWIEIGGWMKVEQWMKIEHWIKFWEWIKSCIKNESWTGK